MSLANAEGAGLAFVSKTVEIAHCSHVLLRFPKGGNTGWQGQLTNDQYLSWLKWFDAQMRQDPEVSGLTIFEVGDTIDFQSFDLAPVAQELANYLVTGS